MSIDTKMSLYMLGGGAIGYAVGIATLAHWGWELTALVIGVTIGRLAYRIVEGPLDQTGMGAASQNVGDEQSTSDGEPHR